MRLREVQGGRWWAPAIAVAALACGVVAVAAQSPPAPERVVARVGKLTVTQEELDTRAEETLRQLRARTGTGVAPAQRLLLRRQVLESLIWQRLVMLEAERRGVPAPSIAEEYQRRAQPDRREVEREVRRRLTAAEIAVLALRRRDYEREPLPPGELEVLDWYRRHPEDFPRPPETHYRVILVDQPALPPAQAVRVDLRREWDVVMQRRADSLLAAIQAGEPFEEAALRFGGARRFVVAEGRPFHPDFRGDAGDLAALRATAPGAVLARTLPWSAGRALVRVDARLPKHPAPLAEVAGQIVERLTAEARESLERSRLRPLYARLADSLRGPGHAVRYAVLDTAGMPVPEPSAAELERHYRLHLADFSTFDAERGAVVASPFDAVRDGIRDRIVRERRIASARERAERLASAWEAGRRDARLEAPPVRLRDAGIVSRGADLDTGAVARAVLDSLEAARWPIGTRVFARPLRHVVVHVGPEVADHRPSFEEARPRLARIHAEADARALESEARALWEREPERFRVGRTVHFSRLIVAPQDLLTVPLTRSEVASHYRAHLADYSAPAAARVSHLLVTPVAATPAADAEARREAQQLLERARSGEDWGALVRDHSDDAATRERGGDVGRFLPGNMLPEFEAAAFQMRPGEIGGPIRTREGWHVLKCLENLPQEDVPLAYCYTNVAADLATQRANEIAAKRADSLQRVLRSPAQALDVARRFNYQVIANQHEIGDRRFLRELTAFFEAIEKTAPGAMVPMAQPYRGLGVAIAWVDSVVPARLPSWEVSRARALELAREERAVRELRMRHARLDSLRRAGWSLDSLGALRGGLERRVVEGPGFVLPNLGGGRMLDSLLFGVESRPAALGPGDETGWMEFPGGIAWLRLEARDEPDATTLELRTSESWRIRAERSLYDLFEDLKRRHPVRILDSDLAATSPPVPVER